MCVIFVQETLLPVFKIPWTLQGKGMSTLYGISNARSYVEQQYHYINFKLF